MATSLSESSLIDEHGPTITRDDCSYYGRLNRTGFGLIRSYEGIPENLLINIIVSAVIQNRRRKPKELHDIGIHLDSSIGFCLFTTSIFRFEKHGRWERVKIDIDFFLFY